MSAKSSSVWASKEQNVPHRSPRFLLTLLSTLSGYTKCSNFTPVWRGTDGVVWKSTQSRTVPQPARGGSALGQKIPRPLQHGPQGRNEFQENNLMESGQFRFFVAEFVILWRGQRLVIGAIKTGYTKWNLTHSLIFAKEDIQVVSLNTLFTAKVLGTWKVDLLHLTCSEFLKPCKQRQWEWRLWLSIVSWNILEYGQNPVLWWLPHEVASCDWEFLCFFHVLSWTAKHIFLPPMQVMWMDTNGVP